MPNRAILSPPPITYRPGAKVFYDSLVAGPVPGVAVRVEMHNDVVGAAGGARVWVKITAARGPHKRGDVIETSGRYAIPRGHLRRIRGKGLRVIDSYRWAPANA